MQVKVITAFNDQTVEDDADRRREIDDTFEANDERATYLETLGYVEKIGGTAPVEVIRPAVIPAAPAPVSLAPPVIAGLGTPIPAVSADLSVAKN